MHIQATNSNNGIAHKASFVNDSIYFNLYRKANKTPEFMKTMEYLNSKCPKHYKKP